MDIFADGVLGLATIAAAAYCVILSRRLSRLNGLDDGLGKAIVSLSDQVEALKTALREAKSATERASGDLAAQIAAAEATSQRLAAQVSVTEDGASNGRPAGPSDEREAATAATSPLTSGDGGEDDAIPPEAIETLDVIRKSPDTEDDDAFAAKLVGALSSLQPKREARA